MRRFRKAGEGGRAEADKLPGKLPGLLGGGAISPTLVQAACLQVGRGTVLLGVGWAWLSFLGGLKEPLQSQRMASCWSTLHFLLGTQSPKSF